VRFKLVVKYIRIDQKKNFTGFVLMIDELKIWSTSLLPIHLVLHV
jgi:hypothetical protein